MQHIYNKLQYTKMLLQTHKRTLMQYCSAILTSTNGPSETLCPWVFLHKVINDFFECKVWNELILR